jgi:hypothetical protein
MINFFDVLVVLVAALDIQVQDYSRMGNMGFVAVKVDSVDNN